jgi:hypothetical protein
VMRREQNADSEGDQPNHAGATSTAASNAA